MHHTPSHIVRLALACFMSGLMACSAQASEALANKNACLGCHAIGAKMVGPAFKDVAAKYAGQTDAQAVLVKSIKNGGIGKWGDMPMPPQGALSDADAKKLAAWILNLK
jgi:cytochrome c